MVLKASEEKIVKTNLVIINYVFHLQNKSQNLTASEQTDQWAITISGHLRALIFRFIDRSYHTTC